MQIEEGGGSRGSNCHGKFAKYCNGGKPKSREELAAMRDEPNHTEEVRKDELFPLIFTGSGTNGAWTASDWERYYANRTQFWDDPESWDPNGLSGWDLFAQHAGRLASHYGSGQRDQFMRDFGLVFAAIPSQPNFLSAAFSVKNGPGALQYLSYSNSGLPSQFLDSENSSYNQSHHYAGIFVLGYFTEANTASFVNVMRDIGNPGDQALGNVAAGNGWAFSVAGKPNQISQLISEVPLMASLFGK